MALPRPIDRTGRPISEQSRGPHQIKAGYKADKAAKRQVKLVDFMEWALQVPESRGALNFDVFPMQRELYETFGAPREGVVQKGTQVGISSWLVRWAMYWADVHGLNMMYVFPTRDLMFRFSDARIRPLLLGDYLRTKVPSDMVQNKSLRAIGAGMLYCVGSESMRDLDSTDADGIAFDEYDTLNQQNVPHAERRISSPLSRAIVRRVGVPTVPQWGVAKQYDLSDQRVWMVKCSSCRTHQEIDFFKNVDQNRLLVVCEKCTKPLDVTKGEWVAKYPDRTVPGYHVHRLLVPGTRHLADIVKASKDREPYKVQIFWNKDLGLPFAPKEGRLSREALAAAQSRGGGYVQVPGYVGGGLVTMGVDVASTRSLHVRISLHLEGRLKQALFIGEVDSFDEVAALMGRYSVNMACVDHLPEGRLAMAFAERFAGQVFLVHFAPTTQNDALKVDEATRKIGVKRTEAMDGVISVIRQQRNLLPLDLPDDYVDHMLAPVRFLEEDELGKIVVGYRSTGPDDFFMAELYDLVALEAWWIRQAVVDASRQEIVPLDSLMEFQRSAVDDPDEMTYRPGPERVYGVDDEEEWPRQDDEWEV